MKKTLTVMVLLFICVVAGMAGTVSYSVPVLTVQSDAQGVIPGSGTLTKCPFSFVETTNTTPVRVSVVEDSPLGTGNSMRASVWLAVTTASLALNRDLSGEMVTFETSGYVDGPSAGGVLCLAVMSAIEGRAFPDDFAMTGTILVDGTIGAVGGVAEKIRAAGKAGVRRICIPSAMRLDGDEGYTDLLDLGKSLGLEIHQVATISDAYRILHRLPENRTTRLNPLEVCRLPQHVESVLKNQYQFFLVDVPKDESAQHEIFRKSVGEFVSGLFGSAIIDLVNGLNDLDIDTCGVHVPPVQIYPALEHELPTNKTSMIEKLVGVEPSRDEYVKELMAFHRDLKKLAGGGKDDELDDEDAVGNADVRSNGADAKKVEDWFDDYVASPSEGQFRGLANNFQVLNDVLQMAWDDMNSKVDGIQDWNALDEAGLNEVRGVLIDKLNLFRAKELLMPGGVVNDRERALCNRLCGSIPYIRSNTNIRQVENLFYRTMKALDSSFREMDLKNDLLLVRSYEALLRIAEGVHAQAADNEDVLPEAVCSEVQVLAQACSLIMLQDSVILGNSAYFSSVVTSARENALANIAECQKLGIPCVMPIICFQCAESRRDTGAVGDDAEENRFSVLENYLDASIGAKALGLCFKGRKPELNAKGYCSKEVIWDAGTSSVTVRYLGVDGEPILRGAFSGYWQQYDSAGGVKCTSWLDKRGYGIRYRLTNEYFTVEYNDIGNRTRKTYCDPSWRPTPKDDGVLFETFGYDADGNETDRAFFNASSNSAVCADGIASIKRRYNARRQEVWRRFYGANGEPAVHRDGNAGFDCVYDKWGNLRRMTAVDTQGNPVMTRHGFAREERKYNAQNQVTEDAWYDEKGRLVCVNGSAKIIASYDDKRNKVSEEYYGADNRLARNDHNYAVAQWTYNAAGEAIECRYYGPDGEPTVDEKGIASWRVVYDAAGRNAGRRYYDLNGNEIDAQEKVPAPAME